MVTLHRVGIGVLLARGSVCALLAEQLLEGFEHFWCMPPALVDTIELCNIGLCEASLGSLDQRNIHDELSPEVGDRGRPNELYVELMPTSSVSSYVSVSV